MEAKKRGGNPIIDLQNARLEIGGRRRKPGLRRVTVLGGAGYVGSVLVRKLLGLGLEVTVMDMLLYGDEGVRDLYSVPGFAFVEGDLRDVGALARAFHECDAIVHLGGLVGDPACALDEQLTIEVNLESTRIVTNTAGELGVPRLIFSSTCAVYGEAEGKVDETSPLNPVSLYARTKMESERMVLALRGEDFAPVIVRFGTFYGLSPRPRFDIVVNLLVGKAVTEGEITIFGGDQWRPFIHVDDGAEAILRCLWTPAEAVSGEVYNVGSDDQNYTLRQIGQLIAELIPGVNVDYRPQSTDEPNYQVSFAKIHEELGFSARHTIVDGIREIGMAIFQGSVGDYQDARFSNIKALTSGEAKDRLEHVPISSPGPLSDTETVVARQR